MKLIIQIPCFNEEASLPIAFAELPRAIDGISSIEYLVIDDGSTDRTVEVARNLGVHHIVRLPRNSGLAKAFMTGLDASLKNGADIVVNTDADNQYCGDDISKLVAPILAGQAELVVGARPIMEIAHFSLVKKILQKLGSWVVRAASRTQIPDAPSGFRAFSRSAAMQIQVFGDYTYTLETIIAAGQKSLAIVSVPIRVNPDLRPSRLVKSVRSYVTKSIVTIVRIFIVYRPFRFFGFLGFLGFMAGFLIALRFLILFIKTGGEGHIQSLIFAAILLLIGFFLIVLGVLADLISVNRKLLESIHLRLWQLEDLLKKSR